MLRHSSSSSLILSIGHPCLINTQIICMSDKFQEGDGLEPNPEFQTAFPDIKRETDEEFERRIEEQSKVTELLCQYGCGQPGQYFAAGPQGGELPRCKKQISDCPARGGVAIRAAKRAGRLGRRSF